MWVYFCKVLAEHTLGAKILSMILLYHKNGLKTANVQVEFELKPFVKKILFIRTRVNGKPIRIKTCTSSCKLDLSV